MARRSSRLHNAPRDTIPRHAHTERCPLRPLYQQDGGRVVVQTEALFVFVSGVGFIGCVAVRWRYTERTQEADKPRRPFIERPVDLLAERGQGAA